MLTGCAKMQLPIRIGKNSVRKADQDKLAEIDGYPIGTRASAVQLS
jgi:hypothetical protein